MVYIIPNEMSNKYKSPLLCFEITKALTEHLLQGNIPWIHLKNAKPIFMSWWMIFVQWSNRLGPRGIISRDKKKIDAIVGSHNASFHMRHYILLIDSFPRLISYQLFRKIYDQWNILKFSPFKMNSSLMDF